MPDLIRLLLVEDSDSDADLLIRQLQKDGLAVEVERVEDQVAMLDMLGRATWDVVVSDFRLPRFGASTALHLLQNLNPDIPFIVVSGAIGEAAAVSLMRHGAKDIIGKDKLWQLAPAIERELEEAETRRVNQHAAKMLRTSEHHYRSLIETINQGFYVTDHRGYFTYVNPAITLAMGYNEKELLGKTCYRLIHPEDRHRVIQAYREWAKTSATDREIEFRTRTRKGRTFWVEQRSQYVRNADGTIGQIRNIVSDITARKLSDQALRESEERYRALIESNQDAVFLLDLTGRIISINPAAARMHGYTEEELIGRHIQSLNVPGQEEHSQQVLAKLLDGQSVSFEIKHHRKDRTVLPLDALAKPITINNEDFILATERDITERLQREEERRRLALLVRETGNAVVITDTSGDVQWINEGFTELTGFTLDEVRGLKPGFFLQGPNTDEEDIAEMRRALKAKEKIYREILNYHKSGRAYWTQLTIQPMHDDDGEFTGFFATSSDITERKLSAEALSFLSVRPAKQDEGDYFSRVAQKLGELLDVQCAFIAAFVGRKNERARSLGYWLRDGENPPRVVEMDLAGTPSGELTEVDKLVVVDDLIDLYPTDLVLRENGYRSYAAIQLTDEAQRPIGLVGLLDNQPTRNPDLVEAILKLFANAMSGELERQQRADQLQNTASLLVATLESTADGILVVDTDQNITQFNQQFVDMWRIPDEMVGASCDGPLVAYVMEQLNDPEAFRRKVEELYVDPAAESFDILEFKDGRVFERLSRPQIVDGETRGRVWSFRDITQRIQAEQARRRVELELFQAQKLESLGTMAGGIAHDFNNILTGIINFCSLAQRECNDQMPQVTKYLDHVLHGSNRAKDLVQQILLFSRAEKTERTPLACHSVVENALVLVRSTLPVNVTLQAQINSNTPNILANATQVHQVVTNICINSAQAFGDSPGIITLDLNRIDVSASEAAQLHGIEAGSHICLKISDNGPGIEPEVMDRIFEPFFTTKPVGEGTGLGLSVVRSIVRSHNGSITVESQPGSGTTFRILFPVHELPPSEVPTDKVAAARAHRQRVLLVDDEQLILESVQLLLEHEGFAVTIAHHPRHAIDLAAAAAATFDVLITDYQMPGMNGLELAQKLRECQPDLPVILTCGFTTNVDQQKLAETKISQVLNKPFEMEDLVKAVSKITAGSGSGPS